VFEGWPLRLRDRGLVEGSGQESHVSDLGALALRDGHARFEGPARTLGGKDIRTDAFWGRFVGVILAGG